MSQSLQGPEDADRVMIICRMMRFLKMMAVLRIGIPYMRL